MGNVLEPLTPLSNPATAAGKVDEEIMEEMVSFSMRCPTCALVLIETWLQNNKQKKRNKDFSNSQHLPTISRLFFDYTRCLVCRVAPSYPSATSHKVLFICIHFLFPVYP